MSETDNPLKVLITDFSEAFAAWLLETPVRRVRPLNVEFPASPSRSDLLFEVIDTGGRIIYLHIELQGRRSHEPMPLRLLNYLARIVERDIGLPTGDNTPRLVSVVIYVGEGAGRGDNGVYQVMGLGEEVALRWQYRPLRLWEMPAERLFELDNPAFLALIGQTRLTDPPTVLPQALSAIRAHATAAEKDRLLTALVSLLRTEEIIKMVERLLEESEELLLDTPFLRRMREMGLREGREKGREEGREEGLEEGMGVGLLLGLREAILDGVVRRFDPSASAYRRLDHYLQTVTDRPQLQQILFTLFESPSMDAFLAQIGVE